ncbi:MAG: carboxyvinyl-carboxyphosphonate phosphorylmutase [Hyphomicrobiales bacterium]|nr:carboxyvinyl-carboxyphosphonate phosphorylmutase [Hyphomicrobiales bacterium]
MRLKQLIEAPEILLAPGIFDGLTALIATQAGAKAIYLSGASLACTRFGRPDIGLVSMAEVADAIAAIRDRTETPLIVDADTGFGNALNVQRTVRMFERMGAGAVQLEDQTLPKRCGHLDGKSLISKAEMVGKIKAALDARTNDQTLIIARTDSIAVEGFSSALDRAYAYASAGADVLFVEALKDRKQMQTAIAKLAGKTPLLINIVEGGKTPAMDMAELQKLGFSLAIFPGGAARAMARTAQDFYSSLLENGGTRQFQDRMFDFHGLNQVIGTEQLIAEGEKYGDDS